MWHKQTQKWFKIIQFKCFWADDGTMFSRVLQISNNYVISQCKMILALNTGSRQYFFFIFYFLYRLLELCFGLEMMIAHFSIRLHHTLAWSVLIIWQLTKTLWDKTLLICCIIKKFHNDSFGFQVLCSDLVTKLPPSVSWSGLELY